MPAAVIQVVKVAPRGVRKSDVVEHDMQTVPPPLVPPHVEVVQYLLEVQPDLDSNLTLPVRIGGIPLRPVRRGDQEILERPDVEPEPPRDAD